MLRKSSQNDILPALDPSMTIGIEAQRVFRERKHGIEIVALELIHALQRLDKVNPYHIYVKPDTQIQSLSPTENFTIIPVKGAPYPIWEQYHLPRKIKDRGLGLLHSTGNTAPLKISIPKIVTLHDVIYMEDNGYRGSTYQDFGNLYRRWVVPRIIDSCAAVITVSQWEKSRIINQLGIPEEKMHLIPNAVNVRFNNKYELHELESVRELYHLPSAFILCLGNAASRKNTVASIQAYDIYTQKASDPVPMVILDYNRAQLAFLLKTLGKEDLMDRIHTPGYIPTQKMPFIYNLASLFLFTSLRESFGLPILESMACGTPVVTSDLSAIPETGGSAAWYGNPNDPESVAYGMLSLLQNSNLYEMFREKGLKRAENFSWDNTATKVLELYKKTIG